MIELHEKYVMAGTSELLRIHDRKVDLSCPSQGEDIDCGLSASYRFPDSNTPVQSFPGPIFDIDLTLYSGKGSR
jgi:hypothetical protein